MLSLRAILLCICLVRHRTWAQEEETTTIETTTTTAPDLTNFRDGYNITKEEVVEECATRRTSRHRFIDLCTEGLCGWKYDPDACWSSVASRIKRARRVKKEHPLFRNGSIAFVKTYYAGKERCERFEDPAEFADYFDFGADPNQRFYKEHELCLDKLDKRLVCQFVPAVISFQCDANVTCIAEDPLLVNVFAASADDDESVDQEERIAEGVTIMARYCFKEYRVNPYRKDINEAICNTLFTKFSNSLAPFYTKKCAGAADVEPMIRAFCASPFGDDLPEQHERSLLISTVDKIDLIYVHIPVNVEKFEMNFRTLNKDPTKVAHLRTDFTTNTCSFFEPEFAVTTKEVGQLTLAPLNKNRIYCVARVMGPTTVGIFPEGELLHIMEKNAYTCFTHVGAPSASIEQIIALEQCVNKKQFEVSCLRLGEFFFFAIVGAKQPNKSVTLRLECRVDSLESKKQTLFQFGADAEGKVSMGCGTSPRKQIPKLLVNWKRVTMVILRRQRQTIKVYVGLPGQPKPVLHFGTPDSLIRVEQLETIVSVDPEGFQLGKLTEKHIFSMNTPNNLQTTMQESESISDVSSVSEFECSLLEYNDECAFLRNHFREHLWNNFENEYGDRSPVLDSDEESNIVEAPLGNDEEAHQGSDSTDWSDFESDFFESDSMDDSGYYAGSESSDID